MDILKQYVVALSITAVAISILAAFVYLKGRKKTIYWTFALYSLSTALWSGAEAYSISTTSKDAALLWWRINHIGVIFIPVFFVHFVYSLLGINHKKRYVIKIIYVIALIFLILDFTKLLIREVVPKPPFNFFINPGIVYPLFFTIWLSLAIYGLIELFKAYFKSSGARRNQLKYLCWGTLIGYIGGAPNFLPTFNIHIPILMPYGTYGVAIYVLAATYAIVRHRLMDITVLAIRTIIFIIVYSILLLIPLLTFFNSKPILTSILSGQNWRILPFSIAVYAILASIAPFIYLFLQRRAEDLLLKDQRRYQKTLRELSRTMTRIRDLDKLLKAIVLTVIDTVKVSFAGVYLKDEEYKSYRLKHYFPKQAKVRFQEFIPLDYPLINLLYTQRRPLLSEEILPQDKIQLDSGLVIPCFIEDTLLGFLVLGAKPNNQMYTPDDVLVFETLSYSTSLAIENCRFWKEIEDRQRKARLQEMDTYSYSLAHEIDNPIQIILGQTGLLQKYLLKELKLPEEKCRDIEYSFKFILEAAKRVSKMVSAIRDFGQASTGKFLPLRITEVVESFQDLFYPQFKAENILFIKEIPEGLAFICGEKAELMQVLVILANNSLHAMKYSQEKKIHLRVEPVNREAVRMTFTDTGCGIKKELLPIIFSPFTTTKASSEGTGMGLYNAKKIIERHKGRIWVESEGENRGAIFYIELPIAKDITKEEIENIKLREDEYKKKRLF